MNAGPRLSTGLSQRIALAPRQSQALRLLALPTLDLEQMLEAALEENALLERLEPESEDFPDTETEAAPEAPEDTWETLDWSSEPHSSGTGLDQERLEALPMPGLRQHVMEQLELERFSARDYAIALAVIDALDDNGYLGESLEEIAEDLEALDPPPDTVEIEAVLQRVQRLEPVGIAARSAAECLLLQLDVLPPQTPALDTAQALISAHFDRLARADMASLVRLTREDEDTVQAALSLIQSLNPRPGSDFSAAATEYLIPELRVRRTPDGWHVEPYPGMRPVVTVNETYAKWLNAHRQEPNAQILCQQLEEARWLVRSLAQREETLLRVARVLVRHQSAFLEHGPLRLTPLTLREVAEELEVHESTVSRAVQGKALATPRGVILLRHLFSNKVSNNSDEGLSATSVRERLRYLLNHEDPTAPLSDAALAQALAKENMPIARRTVAKYREALGFASTRERRRPAHSSATSKR